VCLAILGLALIGTPIVGAVRNWPGGAILGIALVAGVFLLISAIAGAFPKGSFKEGSIEFPDVDKHPRVEKIEADIAALREKIEAGVAGLRAEVETARREARDATSFLIDYILAHEPPPEDEEGPLTDKQRLQEMERALAELSHEIADRYFTGNHYDDGISTTQLEQWQDESQTAVAKERRRQAARVRFGLALNNEQCPVKRD
jgi:hypothetical protein